MFFKFILIILTISISKSWAFLKFDEAIYVEKPKHPTDLIPIRCGLECLLKCLIGNSHFDYGCFDKCSIACTIPLTPNTASKTDEMTQLMNITIGEKNLTFDKIWAI